MSYNVRVAEEILKTKLHRPAVRPSLVARPQLVERMQAGLERHRKVTFIAAPAGFGKTTLVTAWLDRLAREHVSAGWLSLDQNDSDPLRFLRYLTATVRTAIPDFGPGLLGGLAGIQSPDLEAVSLAFSNELTMVSQPLLLVLDDAHLITDAAVLDLLASLIESFPAEVHVVLTSRSELPLPLPRWRARDQMTEVRAADLRFSLVEAELFLKQTMGLALDEAAVAKLERRTEGWVAGLQLAALSLRGSDDPAEQVEAFTGRDRLVADYLVAEVLDQQDEVVRRFLLYSSVLERFSGPLCDYLLEDSGSQAILQRLEQGNLFLEPLDNQRHWYRYHHLFGQLLRDRLRQINSEERVKGLHLRAARWYRSQGLNEEAVQHALAAEDTRFAAELIAGTPSHYLWEQGGAKDVIRWTDSLPENISREYPRISYLGAAANMLIGDLSAARHYLNMLAEEPSLQAEYALMQSIISRNEGDVTRAMHLLEQVHDNLPADDDALRGFAYGQSAAIYCATGRFDEASRVLSELRQQLPTDDATLFSNHMYALGLQGSIAFNRADLYRAETIFREGIALAEQNRSTDNPMIGLSFGGLGEIFYQWNALDEAEDFFQQALYWGRRSGITDVLITASIGLAEIACQQGDRETALGHFAPLQRLAQRSQLPGIMKTMEAVGVSYRLRLGELDHAVRWANASGLTLDARPGFGSLYRNYVLASVRLAESRASGETADLLRLLSFIDHLISVAEEAGHRFFSIRLLLLRANLLDLQKERDAALDSLFDALELAEPGNIIRLFVDGSRPVQELLEAGQKRRGQQRFIRHLLLAFAEESGRAPEGLLDQLAEKLTDREYEVLRLIAAGYSNRQIQDELVISKNTVRTHIKHLYGKLGVSSRTQAVRRANELGIL